MTARHPAPGIRVAALACLAVLVGVAAAHAQAPAQAPAGGPPTRQSRVELSGGVTWTGGFVLEGPNATLTSNTGTSRYTLFSASSKVDAVTGFHARVGVRLTRSLVAEGGFLFSQPSASTQLSGDMEAAAPTTAEETMTTYVVDGGVAYHLHGLSFAGGKGVPFVSGSIGYLRELHEGNTLIETGTQYRLGLGLTVWLGSGRFGIRGEGGVAIRDTGDDSSAGRQSLPTAGLSATYRF